MIEHCSMCNKINHNACAICHKKVCPDCINLHHEKFHREARHGYHGIYHSGMDDVSKYFGGKY